MGHHYAPGPSQYVHHAYDPAYAASYGGPYQHTAPSYTQHSPARGAHHNNGSPGHLLPTYPGSTQAGPPPAQQYAPRYPPQVSYSAWAQHHYNPYANVDSHATQPAATIASGPDEAGGWKYVGPKKKAEDPPTIANFNGFQFDKENSTWIPAADAKDAGKDGEKKAGDGTSGAGWDSSTNNGGSGGDGWNSTNNDNKADDEKKDDGGWGDSGDSKSQSGDNSGSNGWDSKDNYNAGDTWKDSGNDSNENNNGSGSWENKDGPSNDTSASNGWGNDDNKQNSSGGSGWGTSNGSAPATNNDVPRADRTLHGPLGAYFGPKIAVEPDTKAPWIADEPPCYDLPEGIVKQLGLSKQVQRGKGYNFQKKHRKPIYIDTISEPYARFVFKYRTRDKLPRGFDKVEGMEPTPDSVVQMLQEKKKEDLVAELQRWRLAYGDKAPELKVDPNLKTQKEPDHHAWNLEPPKRDYLDYELPGQFPDPANDTAAAPAQQDSGSKWNDSNNKSTPETPQWDSNKDKGTTGNSWGTSEPAQPTHGW
jgi:hypothetical protein